MIIYYKGPAVDAFRELLRVTEHDFQLLLTSSTEEIAEILLSESKKMGDFWK